MMRDLEEGQTILEHLRLEHQRIEEIVGELRKLLDAAEGGASPSVLDETAAVFARLKRTMAAHFQEEEDDGYMEEALIRLPRLSAKVAALHRQHAGLLKELDSVITLLTALRSDGAVRQAFEEFAKRLSAHEAAENCIMAEAFGTDFADEANNA